LLFKKLCEIEDSLCVNNAFNIFTQHTPAPSERPIVPLASAIWGKDLKLVALLIDQIPLVELDIFVNYHARPPRWESAEDWISMSGTDQQQTNVRKLVEEGRIRLQAYMEKVRFQLDLLSSKLGQLSTLCIFQFLIFPKNASAA
jgi:hypothetical protein